MSSKKMSHPLARPIAAPSDVIRKREPLFGPLAIITIDFSEFEA